MLKQKEIEKQDLEKEYLLGIIEVIDSFENKERSLLEKVAANPDAMKTVSSFNIIKKKLLALLSKYDVSHIEFPDNRLIIGLSKVVGTEPDPLKPDDHIISVIRHGYRRGQEVIREAELIIVKN